MKAILCCLFLTVLCIEGRHTTCERNYDNIGCFKEYNADAKDLIINDRDSIDWNNIEAYMHSLACRCDEETRKKNKGRTASDVYVGFSLHYYGECYGKTAEQLRKLLDKTHKGHLCIGDQTYSGCRHGIHKECVGVANAEYVYKFKAGAPKNVDGGFAEWGGWTKCQSDCGPGIRIRERTCTNPEPQGEGKDCSSLGESTQSQPCMSKACPVDGGFSSWSTYSTCSKSCAGGVQERTRSCTSPAPANGGKNCNGATEQTRVCNPAPCPVHGGWSQWTSFEICTKRCGGGEQKRIRGCTNPPPMYGGNDCVGESVETKNCNESPCPVHGGYTAWTGYGSCSKSCGGGSQYRSRTCTNPRPAHGGGNCDAFGPRTEARPCNQQACPIKEFSKTCCEGHSIVASCSGSDRISIRYAMYGRRNKSTCKNWLTWAMRTDCSAGNAYNKVKSTCNGQRSCRIYARNSVFGDPCWGTTKYLKVTYRCQ